MTKELKIPDQKSETGSARKMDFYRQMYLIRRCEELILDLFSKGQLSGTTHTGIGQESCAVGVISALDRERDMIFSNHRGHGHYLTYSGDVFGLLGEMMGKPAGTCGGKGGSQQLCHRNFYSCGVQGALVPVAVGAALAEKAKGSGRIAVIFLGDGTFGEGVVYEGFNMAALWKLPVLFVVENNQYAQSTPSHLQLSGTFMKRAEAFAIKAAEIEARDVTEVHAAAREAVGCVRDGQGPYLLVLNTYRLAPHSKGDDLRPAEEMDYYRSQDPLTLLRCELREQDAVRVKKIEREIDEYLSEQVQRAQNA